LSHIDRSVFTDNSKLSVESLIKNLKNVIMKKLSMSCVTESSVFLSVSSTTSFSAALSQSSTLVPVSGSPALTISVLTTSTSATPGFTVSVFVTSSPCFKKILHKLSESYFSFYFALMSEVILIEDDNTAEITLFYSQASSVTFSLFSAEKTVCTLSYK
ncbi:hypothetical protein BDDG_12554, partial [Blastomyces dermatitidis ATCC 18188]